MALAPSLFDRIMLLLLEGRVHRGCCGHSRAMTRGRALNCYTVRRDRLTVRPRAIEVMRVCAWRLTQSAPDGFDHELHRRYRHRHRTVANRSAVTGEDRLRREDPLDHDSASSAPCNNKLAAPNACRAGTAPAKARHCMVTMSDTVPTLRRYWQLDPRNTR